MRCLLRQSSCQYKTRAATSQRNKPARPFIPIVRCRSHPRNVQQHNEQQKHRPQQNSSEPPLPPHPNTHRCGKKSDTHKISPEQMPRNPRRHKSSYKLRVHKVLNAKHHQRNRKHIPGHLSQPHLSTTSLVDLIRQRPSQHKRRPTQRQNLKSTGPRPRVMNMSNQSREIKKQHLQQHAKTQKIRRKPPLPPGHKTHSRQNKPNPSDPSQPNMPLRPWRPRYQPRSTTRKDNALHSKNAIATANSNRPTRTNPSIRSLLRSLKRHTACMNPTTPVARYHPLFVTSLAIDLRPHPSRPLPPPSSPTPAPSTEDHVAHAAHARTPAAPPNALPHPVQIR